MQNNESKKVILGLAMATVVGATLLYYLRARHRPTPVLHTIGKTIVEVGEMLENCNLGNLSNQFVKKVENHVCKKGDFISNFIDWSFSGLNLWNKLKK